MFEEVCDSGMWFGLLDWLDFRVLPFNVPLKRAGVYLIVNRLNGKKYVGMSAADEGVGGRGRKHGHGLGSPKRLRNALKYYGKENFLFVPLLYTVGEVTREWLCGVESDLIEVYDSINNGYNIVASGSGIGPYGEAFSAALRAAMADPEYKARKAARESDPELRARRSAAAKVAWARPEVKDSHVAGANKPSAKEKVGSASRERWTTPEFREAMALGMTPEVREKQRANQAKTLSDPAIRVKYAASAAKASEAARAPEAKEKLRVSLNKRWDDQEQRMLASTKTKAAWDDPEMGSKLRELAKDPDRRAKLSAAAKAAWAKRRDSKQLLAGKEMDP